MSDILGSMDLGSLFVIVLALLGALIWYYNNLHGPRTRNAYKLYTRDLTALARDGELDPVVGRDREISRVIDVISRHRKNNPLLIGEPGVGKTAIVHGLADRLAAGKVPAKLRDMSLIALDLPKLLSGATQHGELERRMRDVIDRLASLRGRTILFVDELQLIGKDVAIQGGLNVSEVLKPELMRGDIAVIGATNWSEYQEVLRRDPAIERRFQPVVVAEPDKKTALLILARSKGVLERHHGVRITPDAVRTAVDQSVRYIHDRFLPDKAIDILDEACAAVAVAAESAPKRGKDAVKGAPTVKAQDVQRVIEGWMEYYRASQDKR